MDMSLHNVSPQTLGSLRTPIILDAQAALLPMGFQLAVSLSRLTEVWLVREFVSLISPTSIGIAEPQNDQEEVNGDQEFNFPVSSLTPWRLAFVSGILQSSFCCIGDAPSENFGRFGNNSNASARFDALLQKLNPGHEVGWSPIVVCGLQCFALAAALSPTLPLILTARSPDKGTPIICRDIATANIQTEAIEGHRIIDQLLPANASPHLKIAACMDTYLAGVLFVAPRAGLVAVSETNGEYIPDELELTLAELQPFQNAKALYANLN